MKNLDEHLKETLCKQYNMPHKYSFITLEEFCELNNISEDNITDEQVNYFYKHYGESRGLPASTYAATHDHNDWIIENFQSHDHKIVVRRLQKLLGNYIVDINTEKLSEKYTDARIVRIALSKDCDIFNDDSTETFKLNDNKLAKSISDILNFHNYYITLIYFYDNCNVIIIEPKQTKNATDFVKQYKYIYHVTDKVNLEKIFKRGLRPNTKKTTDDNIYRYYTDRLFLIVGSNNIKNDLISVIQDLGYSIYSEDYAILKIDVSKLNFTFWWDDASKGNTVYTVESIPPKFIEVINIDNV